MADNSVPDNTAPNNAPHVLVENQSGILVLTVDAKELSDYELCTAIGHEMHEAITRAETAKVVIDLQHVEYIASVGVVPFLNAKRCVSERSGRLVLCHLSDFVHQVFSTTQLLINPGAKRSVFDWAQTRDDAIAMLHA